MRSGSFLFFLVVVCAACDGAHDAVGSRAPAEHAPPPTPTSGANDEPPPAPPQAPPAIAAPPGSPGSRAPTPTEVVVLPIPGVQEGEDGHGTTIAARDPVAIEVRGHVGGQALGPELSVGQLRFVRHSYPSAGIVRFVCADRALLPVGAEVALVYGTRRTVITTSLVVPQ